MVTKDGFQEQGKWTKYTCEIHNHLHFDANGVNENNFWHIAHLKGFSGTLSH